MSLFLTSIALSQPPFQGLDKAWGKPLGGEAVKGGLKGYFFKQAERMENGQKVFYYQVSNPNDRAVRILFTPTAGLNVNVEYSGGPYAGKRFDLAPGTSGIGYLKNLPAEYDLGPGQSFVMRIASNGPWTYFPARGHVFWTKPIQEARAAATPKLFELTNQKGEKIRVTTDIPAEYFGDYEYKHEVYGYRFRLQKDGPSYYWPQTLNDKSRPSAGFVYDPARREDFTTFGLQVNESGQFVTYPKNIRFGVDVDAMKLQYEREGKVWAMGLYTVDGRRYAGEAVKSD